MFSEKFLVFTKSQAFSRVLGKIGLTAFVFLLLTGMVSAQEEIEVVLNCDLNPSVSSYRGFSAFIPVKSAEKINRQYIKFTVNGQDLTNFLETDQDKDGNLTITFYPVYPLPPGTVNNELSFVYSEDKTYRKTWSFVVNPYLDKSLASHLLAVQLNPDSVKAHYELGKAYEKSYLLRDAQDEYLKILTIEPSHQLAQRNYDRIFSSWDKKWLSKENVNIMVAVNDELVKLGKLIIFKVKINNTTTQELAFNPEDCVLVDSAGNQLRFLKIERLEDYPKMMLDRKIINLADYARLSYVLEKRTFLPFKQETIFSGSSMTGHLFFSLGRHSSKTFTLTVLVKKEGKTLTFRFPFTRC